jgi:uncharacterized membrane protein HdeD (DUF308 family)
VSKTKIRRKKMEPKQISGILSIILGLIFIIFPVVSSATVSIIIGVSLLFLGIATILTGFTAFNIVIGILAIIFGFLFIFNIDALSFILGFQFYIIGIILVLLGLAGLFSGQGVSKMVSILIIILGIVAFALGGLSINNPLYVAILIGVCLIIQGIRLVISD